MVTGKEKVVWDELKTMIIMGVIEEPWRNWSSSVVVELDFREVNTVSKFVAMPCIDALLGRLGTARFYSTLELAQEILAGSLDSNISRKKKPLHLFVTHPFGFLDTQQHFNIICTLLKQCMCGVGDAFATFESCPEITESDRTHSKLGEVCYWTGGRTISELPLGPWAGAPPN